MINIGADDYGLDPISSMHIQECIDKCILDRVSVFPNFGEIDLNKIRNGKNVKLSLHLNLVEGRSISNPAEISLIADENGSLKHRFVGLLALSLLRRKAFKEQVYKEIKAQILYWESILPEDMPFSIDSHQHVHMIPAIFKIMLKILHEEKICVEHIRIPAEPLSPYLKTPSLYFSYSVINVIKQWLLKLLWQIDKVFVKAEDIHTSCFFGILFSGNMDEKRVRKILPLYAKYGERHGMDIDISFHPGYLDKDNADFGDKNVAFRHFYLSDKRKTEYDTLINISKEE